MVFFFLITRSRISLCSISGTAY